MHNKWISIQNRGEYSTYLESKNHYARDLKKHAEAVRDYKLLLKLEVIEIVIKRFKSRFSELTVNVEKSRVILHAGSAEGAIQKLGRSSYANDDGGWTRSTILQWAEIKWHHIGNANRAR